MGKPYLGSGYGYFDENEWDEDEYSRQQEWNQANQRASQYVKPEKVTYESVEKLIKMPKTTKIAKQDHIFRKFERLSHGEFKVSPETQNKAKDVYEALQGNFSIWEGADRYKFHFPESKFQQLLEGYQNDMNYEQKFDTQQEDTFKPKLSAEQLEQIAKTGTFQVRSNNQLIILPYVWKINEILFRGTDINHKNWLKGLANIYSIFSTAYRMVRQEIPREIKDLSKIPKRIFSLIFGKHKHRIVHQINYSDEVAKDFFSDLYSNEFKLEDGWGKHFWMEFFVQYDHRIHRNLELDPRDSHQQAQRKANKYYAAQEQYNLRVNKRNAKMNQFTGLDNLFRTKWGKMRKRIIKETSTRVEEKTQKAVEEADNEDQRMLADKTQKEKQEIIRDIVQGRKLNLYTTFLKEQLPKKKVKGREIQTITTLVHLFNIINIKLFKFNQGKVKAKQDIENQVRKKHSIRSLSNTFFNNYVDTKFSKLQAEMNKDFYRGLLEDQDFVGATSEVQRSIYKKYLKYKEQFEELVKEKKKSMKCLAVPSRIFKSTYSIMPPYPVNQTITQGKKTYSVQKYKEMTIDTTEHFWKIKLYVMRLKCWTINCYIFLIRQAYIGSFGLRCLIGTQQFQYGENIVYETGVKTYKLRKPLLAVFKDVLQGIRKSRENFQALPDRGIFGKRYSRILNYIQCYLFRLVIVGILIVVILYPICIVLNVVLSTILVVTVWVWIPLIMSVCYIWNILIFQFESSYVPHGVMIRSMPLLSLILVVLKCVFTVVFCILNMFIFAPVMGLLVLLFRIIQRTFRALTDSIMFYMIKYLGRTPSRDTGIAWKISGPGMSKSCYMSIGEEDVCVLTQAQLEKKLVNKYNQLVTQKISCHQTSYMKTIQNFLKPYLQKGQHAPVHYNIISNNKASLMNNYTAQFNKYMNRYPNTPSSNVRFTEEEIGCYFDNSVQIVKNFVDKNGIAQWIFEEMNIDHLAYDELTHQIWVQIFGCGQAIFEPLQSIDKRFKLQEVQGGSHDRMKRHVGSVMNALQGEVHLKKQNVNMGHFSPGLIQMDPIINYLSQLVQTITTNSLTYVRLDPDSITCAFVPHLNILEARKLDQYQYQYKLKTQPRAFMVDE